MRILTEGCDYFCGCNHLYFVLGLHHDVDTTEEQRVPGDHHQPVQLPALPAEPPQLQPQAALHQDQQAQTELQQESRVQGAWWHETQECGLRGAAVSGQHLQVSTHCLR